VQRRLIGPVAGLLLLTLGGCGPFGDDGTEQAERVAAALAAALSEGELGEVPAASAEGGEPPADSLATVLADVGEPPSVSVDDVVVVDDTATVALDWSWERSAGTWTYETEAELRRPAEGEVRESATGGWEVAWQPAVVHPVLTEGDRLRETRLTPARGNILGADDRPLVEPRPVRRVGVDKTGLSEPAAARAARQVARLVGIAAPEYVERVAASGERAFVEAIVYRVDDLEPGLATDLAATPGVRLLEDELPLAPSRDFAAALLGTVGPATAEIVEESDGRISAGDEVGRSGLQLRYDEELSGAAGVSFEAVSDASDSQELFVAEPTDGSPVRTSLDLDAQARAQRLLADVGPPSALVAVRPSTGEIVAAASGPGSDGLNTATFGQYAPGSTYKIVSSLALLRQGLRPDSAVSCEPTATVDGREFENYDDYPASGLGRITLLQAVASSCNTAFISEAGRLAPQDLGRAAAALGFGVDHDLGFPAYFGQVPPAESETGAAADLIGQGTVLASPLAMATVMASVVRGEAVLPRLLPDVEVEQVEPEQPLTGAEAGALRRMLRAVVEQGSGSVLAGLGGGPVLAKTGTAEYGDQPPLPTHAWMVAARGDLAVAAFVETGDSGSSTAGPLLRDFLGAAR
jgi:cell division protein FtsI/penicillin-binding protein 2